MRLLRYEFTVELIIRWCDYFLKCVYLGINIEKDDEIESTQKEEKKLRPKPR